MKISPLYRTVLTLAAPAVVELVLTSATSLADTIMVGKLGAYAISAVGLTSQPRFIMLATFIALNVGTTALVARFKGQGNKGDAELVTTQSIILAFFIAILLSVFGTVFARPMVRFMGAGPDTVEAATSYFRILMLGFVPTVLPIAISALLRGVGDTRISMKYNLTANLVNIFFNYLLIYGKFGFPRLEVAGAAIATVIGNTAGCGMAFWAILGTPFRKPGKAASEFIELHFTRKNCVPNFPMLKRLFKIGLPSAAEQLALRVGLLLYTLTITALGTKVFAAHQIALAILNLSFVVGQAFGIAATSLTGQALGRGDPEGARTASVACQKMGALIAAFFGLCMIVFRVQLVRLFSDDPEIIILGASVMMLSGLIQPFLASFQIYAGALRGAGDSLYPAISMAIGILCIRPGLAYLLINVFSMGLFGAWLALVVDQMARFVFIAIRYRKGKWIDICV
ncbi:MAG TPA: MATE family efflux transporter [Rectinemataceae bacterium]|nr:MATE family efflux transporter [Rectinemataceae bacterium]